LLNVRSGTRIQHFYHISNEKCTNIYSEPETIEHQKGKLLIYNFLKKHFSNSQVHIEYKIEETNQRSDVILIHENGERWAFEFQCSSIKYDILVERHRLYINAGVKDFWILNDTIHKYGLTNKEQDTCKHRISGLEKAIYDNFYAIYYLNPTLELFRFLRYDLFPYGSMIEGKDFICKFDSVVLKNGYWYTEEDRIREDEHNKKIEFQKNNYTQLLIFRVIDYYYRSGNQFQGTISIVNICKDGKLTEVQLIKDLETEDEEIIHKEPNPLDINSKKKIMIAYNRYKTKMENIAAIVDSPMDWVKCKNLFTHDYSNFSNMMMKVLDKCVNRYAWWNKDKKWYLPKDNRNIKWNL
jgi:competence CoiA-like predicted nuclease